MSVRTMAKVWDLSRHGGSELLIMLAIADFADDDGRAYPSVGTLAKKTRMSARNVNHILASLRCSGELEVKQNEGPRGTNRYRIRLEAAAPLKPPSPLNQTSAPEGRFTPEAPVILKPASSTPEAGFLNPLKPASDEPSLNHQEPPVASAEPTAKVPACPFQDILALYHEILPELPRARLMTKERERLLRNRWSWIFRSRKSDKTRRAATAHEALAWLREFFERAAANDFLMGRVERSAKHANWRCDIDFLLSDKGLKQVIEKTEVAV